MPAKRGGREPSEFVPWKPDRCQEPGCKVRHPSFSHNGTKGPWLCKVHYDQARNSKAQAEPSKVQPEPAPDHQPGDGRLL